MLQVNNSIDSNFLQVFRHTLPAGTRNNKLPTSNDRGFVFVGSLKSGKMEQKPIWTRKSLKKQINEQYVTAAAFWNSKLSRTIKNLRWIVALPLDFDGAQDPHDLALKIADAGLPPASMMVPTPSGGIHVWWFLRPVRATARAVRLYTALQGSLATELGADVAAVGAERLWRLPTSQVIYSGQRKYKLSVFRNWRDENRPEDMPGQQRTGQVYAFTHRLLVHSGIKQLMRGVSQGCRNEACFALAVAHIISGYSFQEALQILMNWNKLNLPPMREQEVIKCLKSAAKGIEKDYRHYYNAMRCKIRNITGEEIKYRPITLAIPREKRKRSHLTEWKQDLILLLQKRGGRMLITQKRLASMLGAPLRSLKMALYQLEAEGLIYRDSVARGKKSFTIIIAKIPNKCKKLTVHTGTHVGIEKNSGIGGIDGIERSDRRDLEFNNLLMRSNLQLLVLLL